MKFIDNNKKILFVIPYLWEGGAQRALSNITTHFPSDWDIDILVNADRVIEYPFRGNIITLGISEKPRTGSVIFQFKVFLKRVRKLKYLKKSGNYRACISFLDSANVANILSGKRYCRTIVSVRISLVQSAQNLQYRFVVNPLVRVFYRWADKVVAVSEGVRKELIDHFRLKEENVVTIENGYHLPDIHRQGTKELDEMEKKMLSGKNIFVTTGRLSAQKGQWHLIRAFAEVVRQVPDTILILIGSGELEEYLKKLAKAYKIEGNVYFTGHVSNPYQYLSRSDIFVFSSMYEGFPNALAEAVCMGLPCISTDFRTGAREILAPDLDIHGNSIVNIVEAEYGILTPLCSGKQYRDPDTPLEQAEQCLAKAMIKLLLDGNMRTAYQQKSKSRSEMLKIESVIDQWIDVIEAL